MPWIESRESIRGMPLLSSETEQADNNIIMIIVFLKLIKTKLDYLNCLSLQ